MKSRGFYQKGIVSIVLIIISIISSIAIMKVNLDDVILREVDFQKITSSQEYLEHVLYSENNINRLNEGTERSGFLRKDDSEVLDYAVRKTIIENYAFTKEFADNNPELFTVLALDDSVRLISKDVNEQSEEDELAIKENKYSTQNGNYQQPKVATVFMTNMEEYKNQLGSSSDKQSIFDPSKIDISKQEAGIITRTYKVENNRLEPVANTKPKVDAFEKSVFDSMTTLMNRSSVLKEGIISIDSYVSTNLNDANVVRILNSEIVPITYMLKGVIFLAVAIFITMIFATIVNYEKAENYEIYGGKNIPIELYMMLFVFVFTTFVLGMGASISFIMRKMYEMAFNFNTTIIFVMAFAGVFVATYITFYGIYSLKSIYKEGFKSYVFRNSITVKLFRFLKRVIGRGFRYFFGDFNPTSKLLWLGIFFIAMLGAYMTTWLIFRSNFISMLSVILVVVVFYWIRKYLYDFEEVEKVSDHIASGDYHIKIDENENGFKKLSQNLNKAGDSLSLAIGKELQSERMKTELITNVSHDLKTPLTSIINYSELITDENTSTDQVREYAKVINEKSHKLKDLIESLFEISKVSSKNVELNYMDLDLKQILDQSIGEWLDKYDEKGLNVVMNTPENPVIVSLDGQYASRILDNVFSNIYKYSLENTRVYIDLYEKDKKLVVKNISKYPLNISADELMERFTRGDASRNTEGSGLGLSIAKSLTELMNGKFDLEIMGDVFKVEINFGADHE